MILIGTHNIGFHEDLTKIIFQLSKAKLSLNYHQIRTLSLLLVGTKSDQGQIVSDSVIVTVLVLTPNFQGVQKFWEIVVARGLRFKILYYLIIITVSFGSIEIDRVVSETVL